MSDLSDKSLYERALGKALRLLTYGARSKAGLYRKLRDAGHNHEPAEAAIVYCEGQGLINDKKMAASYVAYAVESKRYGKHRVLQELYNRGIDRELAQEAYETYIDENTFDDEGDIDLENAVETLEKRMRQKGLEADDLDFDERRRLTDYLHRRGFSFGTISRAFAEIQEDA